MKKYFIKVTDAFTNKEMLIRGDLIFKIEESSQHGKDERLIIFEDGDSEYVLDTMWDLIQSLRKFNMVE